MKSPAFIYVFIFSGSISWSLATNDLVAPLADDKISKVIIHSLSDSNKDLAHGITNYIAAIEAGDWGKAHTLRSKKFQQLYPISKFLKKINEESYTVKKYEILNGYMSENWCRFVVRVQDAFSDSAFYSVAWWGKTKRGWVCIDDGIYIFTFYHGRIAKDELAALLGEE